MDPDLALLDRWCAGDRQSGNALFKRHFDSVYSFFEHKVGEDVDELVQNTFLACSRSRDAFRRQCTFRTYLFAIARHQLYAHLRRHHGRALDGGVTSLADLSHTTPGTQIARGQDHQRLLAALRGLPLDTQLLLELHYWEDMDSNALAEVFDVANTTARTRLFRARTALRERLEKTADEPVSVSQSIEDLDAWARAICARAQKGQEG